MYSPVVSGGKDKGGYLQINIFAKLGWVRRETELISFPYPDAKKFLANKFKGDPEKLDPEFNGMENREIMIRIHI